MDCKCNHENRTSILTDILIGIVGSVIGRWFFGSVLGIGSALSAGAFSLLGIVWGIIGAIVVIAVARAIMSAYYREERMGPSYHEEIRRRKDEEDKYK
jgi:uncharacterized membrane protein YeaQ/YmgE (transglycosylase-associated protein family)